MAGWYWLIQISLSSRKAGKSLMSNRIKCLEMMGYYVQVDGEWVIVSIKTKRGYVAYCKTPTVKLFEDFAVEQIVKIINDQLIYDM